MPASTINARTTSVPAAGSGNLTGVGWRSYNAAKSQKLNGISKWDAHNQYLAYHEGWGGFRNSSYRSKAWLMAVAGKVDQRSRRYASQYNQCKDNLGTGSWFW
jgi:hypothetical protein